MAKNISCQQCGKLAEIKNKKRICVNLGCIHYNKIVRRKYAYRQKGYEKSLQAEEEE